MKREIFQLIISKNILISRKDNFNKNIRISSEKSNNFSSFTGGFSFFVRIIKTIFSEIKKNSFEIISSVKMPKMKHTKSV